MSTLPFRRRPLIEELEPRLLFSADLAPFALDTAPPAPEQRLLDSNETFAAQTATVRHELVIVDAGVVDYATLLGDIRAQAGDPRQLDVVILDSTRDGIAQLSDMLKSYEQLDALHIIAHGAAGELQLGNQRIDAASLDARASDIAAWRQAFSAEADLLLYGCDIASSSAGEQWIASLSQLTGTEVAASTNLTGDPAQQGDWVLEAQTGAIESSLLLGSVQTVWQGTLNINATPGQTLANTPAPSTSQTTTPSSRQVAINPIDGSFVVVWTGSDGNGTGISLRQFNADGSPRPGGEIQVNTVTSNDQRSPDLAMNANGDFVVVWQSNRSGGNGFEIYGQRYNAAAVAQGTEFRVNATMSGDQTSPSVAIDGNGGFVVAWESGDANDSGIYAQRFNSLGNKIKTAGKDEFRVNSETNLNQTQPAVAMNTAGAFVIVWASEQQDVDLFDNESDGVYGRLFDATGNTVNAEFRVNWATGGNQTTPDVAMNDAGTFVVVLVDDVLGNPNIDAFMFNSAGTRQGLGTLVTGTTGLQNSPTVDIRGTGDFLVTWESENQDGSGYAIVARHFKSDYTAYSSEQIINVETTGDQRAPSVAWNGQQAVFAWSGSGPEDAQGVYFRQAAINTPPVISSNGSGNSATISVPENTTAVTRVTATDIDGHTPRFSLNGGADASKFTIDSATGDLSFQTAPNFEDPKDSNRDNIYQVTVQVSDDNGGSDTQTLNVKVTDSSDAPVLANDVYSTNQLLPFTIAAPGLLENDIGPDNAGLTVISVTQPSLGSVTVNPDGSFTYTPDLVIAGQTSFTYTAANGAGLSSTTTVYINVTLLNTAPTTSNVNLGNLDEDSIRLITRAQLLGNANDFENDNLSIVNLALTSGGGTLVSSGNDQWTYTPALNNTGAVTFSYRVSDGNLDTAGSASLNLTPLNDAPTASPIPDENAIEDTPYSVQFATTVFNDVDVGDTLTYTATGLPTWLAFDAGTRTFFGTPDNSDVGTVAITVRATDTSSEWVEATFNLTVANVNDAPVIISNGGAANASVLVSENTTVVTTVSASDVDLPTQTLTYSLVGGADQTRFSLDAASGELSFLTAPNYESPDDANGDGIYDVLVQVTDGQGGSDSQTLAITLADVNEAPTAQNDTYTLNQDGTLVVPALGGLLSNDTDPENDTLSITRVVAWVGNGSGVLNKISGAFDYTPDAGFTGQDSFSYEITDGQGNTAVATVTLNVNPINHAPTVSMVVLAPLGEDGARLITQSDLLAGASDPDGDFLTATGLTINSGSGSLVDHGNGTWTYTPTLNDDSSVSFSYTVSDGSLSTSGAATLDITPVNDAPVFTSTVPTTATEDTSYSTLINATDPDTGALLQFSAPGLPGWLMLVDHGDGTATLSGTPTNADTGSHSIAITVSDGSLSASHSFMLTVNNTNDAPTLTTRGLDTVPGAATRVTGAHLQATDVDHIASELSYVLESPPAQGTLTLNGIALALGSGFTQDDLDNARVVYTATATVSATDSIRLRVSDRAGASVAGVLTVQVTAPPRQVAAAAPVFEPAPPTASPAEPNEAGAPAEEAALSPVLAPVPTDTGTAVQGDEVNPQIDAIVPNREVLVASLAHATPLPTQSTSINAPLLTPLGLALKAMSSEVHALELLNLSLGNNSFQQQLDQIQNEIREQLSLDKNTVASSLAISTGLSVGYVLWLVRGGVLLSSLLSTLPAWRLIDPLPILGTLKRRNEQDDNEQDDDDSLEGLLKKSSADSEVELAGEKND